MRVEALSSYENFRHGLSDEDDALVAAAIAQLAKRGSAELARTKLASKLKNDIWELRPRHHRVLYFLDSEDSKYVLVQGFRKASQRTPRRHIELAERRIRQYLEAKKRK